MAAMERAPPLLRAVTVAHPAPSALNAFVTAAVAIVAGAAGWVALSLALAMLGFQFSIGALNDLADLEADRRAKPGKPLPAGLVSTRVAMAIVVAGAAVGTLISAAFGLAVLVLGLLGYAAGVAYDLVMRRVGLGWLCLAAAIPLMLAWAWQAAAGSLPPGWPLLLPLAALAGATLHLANSLVDVGADGGAGRRSLATDLGPARARRWLATLQAAVHLLAWLSLLAAAPVPSEALALVILASVLALVGVSLSWRAEARMRDAGWLVQAVGLGLLAVAWLASVA